MASEEEYPANETVYVNNLNEKLSKDELKKCLYLFFSQYGRVLDVIAAKTMRMRGQAFIVFEDLHSSNRAIDGANGHSFFGKEMRVTYAKTKSKALLENQGKIAEAAAIARDAAKLQRFKQPVESNKRKNRHRRDRNRNNNNNNNKNKNKNRNKNKNKNKSSNKKKSSSDKNGKHEIDSDNENTDSDIDESDSEESNNINSSDGDIDIDTGIDIDMKENGDIGRYTLLIEGIPSNIDNGDEISKLFQRYDEFLSFTLDRNRPGIAHVSYKTHSMAKKVQKEMQSYKLDIDNQFRITFE